MITYIDSNNNKHEITQIVYVDPIEVDEQGKPLLRYIQYVKTTTKTIWEAIRSCFGAGRWINIKPWSNTEGWRNI